MRKSILFAFILAALLTGGPVLATQPPFAGLPLVAKEKLGDVSVEIYRSTEDMVGAYRIMRSGHVVHSESPSQTGFYAFNGMTEDTPVAPRKAPLLNDGRPAFVISEWTGGAHCCLLLHIFTTEPKVDRVAIVQIGHTDAVRFVRRNRQWVLPIYDWTFAYWKTDFADSPAPPVVLAWKDGAFKPALDLMKTPPTNLKKLSASIGKESWTRESPPPALWTEMLELIYGGRARDAFRLLDLAWPPQRPGKEEFRQEFQKQLESSPYWSEIRTWDASAAPGKE
jgi:hypothetical protein